MLLLPMGAPSFCKQGAKAQQFEDTHYAHACKNPWHTQASGIRTFVRGKQYGRGVFRFDTIIHLWIDAFPYHVGYTSKHVEGGNESQAGKLLRFTVYSPVRNFLLLIIRH